MYGILTSSLEVSCVGPVGIWLTISEGRGIESWPCTNEIYHLKRHRFVLKLISQWQWGATYICNAYYYLSETLACAQQNDWICL